jgi:stearoyl-CoA desaturase (delta-9 desaturase)
MTARQAWRVRLLRLCTYTLPSVHIIACAEMRDIRIIRSRHFHRMQRRHFVMFDVLPIFGTLVALGLLFYRPIGWPEIGLFFAMWLLTGLGLTVGYHRLFTHRAFATSTPLAAADLERG